MAIKTITYNELWVIEIDAAKVKEQFPSLFFFNENRFTKFFQQNAIHLKALHSRVHDIQRKYIAHDENNNPLRAEGAGGEWQYLESVVGKNGQLLTGDAVAQAYKDEVTAFLNRSITVEL